MHYNLHTHCHANVSFSCLFCPFFLFLNETKTRRKTRISNSTNPCRQRRTSARACLHKPDWRNTALWNTTLFLDYREAPWMRLHQNVPGYMGMWYIPNTKGKASGSGIIKSVFKICSGLVRCIPKQSDATPAWHELCRT